MFLGGGDRVGAGVGVDASGRINTNGEEESRRLAVLDGSGPVGSAASASPSPVSDMLGLWLCHKAGAAPLAYPVGGGWECRVLFVVVGGERTHVTTKCDVGNVMKACLKQKTR